MFRKTAGKLDEIRRAVRQSYHTARWKHSATPGDNPGLPPHEVAMVEALKQRYAVNGVEIPEMAAWAEAAPFLNLEPEDGVEAMAEYIIFKERPRRARKWWLAERVNFALSGDTDFTLIAGPAFLSGVPWVTLLTLETELRPRAFLERVPDPEEPS